MYTKIYSCIHNAYTYYARAYMRIIYNIHVLQVHDMMVNSYSYDLYLSHVKCEPFTDVFVLLTVFILIITFYISGT